MSLNFSQFLLVGAICQIRKLAIRRAKVLPTRNFIGPASEKQGGQTFSSRAKLFALPRYSAGPLKFFTSAKTFWRASENGSPLKSFSLREKLSREASVLIVGRSFPSRATFSLGPFIFTSLPRSFRPAKLFQRRSRFGSQPGSFVEGQNFSAGPGKWPRFVSDFRPRFGCFRRKWQMGAFVGRALSGEAQ